MQFSRFQKRLFSDVLIKDSLWMTNKLYIIISSKCLDLTKHFHPFWCNTRSSYWSCFPIIGHVSPFPHVYLSPGGRWSRFLLSNSGFCYFILCLTICSPSHDISACLLKQVWKENNLSWGGYSVFCRFFFFFLELLSDLVQDRISWYVRHMFQPEWFITRRPPFTVHMWDLCDYV